MTKRTKTFRIRISKINRVEARSIGALALYSAPDLKKNCAYVEIIQHDLNSEDFKDDRSLTEFDHIFKKIESVVAVNSYKAGKGHTQFTILQLSDDTEIEEILINIELKEEYFQDFKEWEYLSSNVTYKEISPTI